MSLLTRLATLEATGLIRLAQAQPEWKFWHVAESAADG